MIRLWSFLTLVDNLRELQARNTILTSLDLFADHHGRREFNQIELVKLEPIEGAYVMAVGDFRMPDD